MNNDRTCAHCGASLDGKRANAKYCSRNHKRAALRARVAAELQALRQQAAS